MTRTLRRDVGFTGQSFAQYNCGAWTDSSTHALSTHHSYQSHVKNAVRRSAGRWACHRWDLDVDLHRWPFLALFFFGPVTSTQKLNKKIHSLHYNVSIFFSQQFSSSYPRFILRLNLSKFRNRRTLAGLTSVSGLLHQLDWRLQLVYSIAGDYFGPGGEFHPNYSCFVPRKD